jgi:predicted DNA-binding transcriptional regulator AlpA
MELLTVKEAADFLRLSVSCLNQWRVKGIGPPYIKLGSRVVYAETDLRNWVAKQ